MRFRDRVLFNLTPALVSSASCFGILLREYLIGLFWGNRAIANRQDQLCTIAKSTVDNITALFASRGHLQICLICYKLYFLRHVRLRWSAMTKFFPGLFHRGYRGNAVFHGCWAVNSLCCGASGRFLPLGGVLVCWFPFEGDLTLLFHGFLDFDSCQFSSIDICC